MRLTSSNYYSREANAAYWSASFVKSMLDCPARTLAELRGEYTRPESTALLVGNYVDSYFEGPKYHAAFIAEHPEIFNSRTGELKRDYQKANEMIARAESDKVFMSYLSGYRQRIFTGEIDGIPFKCKLDFYKAGVRIVDFKTVKDFENGYDLERGTITFAEVWNWPLQMAIYRHLVGGNLPCYLACVTKQDPPDLEVVEIPPDLMNVEFEALRAKLPYFDAMRQGIVEPEGCGKCAYCRGSKKIRGAISLNDFY